MFCLLSNGFNLSEQRDSMFFMRFTLFVGADTCPSMADCQVPFVEEDVFPRIALAWYRPPGKWISAGYAMRSAACHAPGMVVWHPRLGRGVCPGIGVTTLAWGRDKNGKIARWFESINSFLFDLHATSYAAWIDKEYSTRHLKLGRGRFVRDLVLLVDFKPTITQETIENKLKQLISQKILPLNADGNALTIILVPPGVRVQRPSPFAPPAPVHA